MPVMDRIKYRFEPRAPKPRGERFPSDLTLAEQDERKAARVTRRDYGTRWRAAFREITGSTPKLKPNDRQGAAMFLSKIQEAIRAHEERSDDTGAFWSASELCRLRQMAKVWERRASGEDLRFVHHGNRPGRTPYSCRAGYETRPLERTYTSITAIIEGIQRAIRESQIVR